MMRNDPLWYLDAVIYEVHVKAFFDSNNDGVGDFRGLTEKLDYLESLGVTCLWLLPFYPSPLRDDGYDIADYGNVNPAYGSLKDFRRFVAEAHKRGLRIITELVINHTSDQHPWFQRARKAKASSVWRDFYVWSDDDQKYDRTRIIFTDTEASNWAWDPEAKAYYWHRFFSHQPDLNFDNPRVIKGGEERHEVLARRRGRRAPSRRHSLSRRARRHQQREPAGDPRGHQGSSGLAQRALRGPDVPWPEANQWPEDVSPYFGEGDECHMAFHFPLMPRIYMALAQEDRHPITDILRQTPDNPRQLPVGHLPAQSRRADAGDGHRPRARLSVALLRRRSAGPASMSASAAAWRRCWTTTATRSSC